MVTGNTENKLFRVRTLDTNNLYQVGVNGVLDVEQNGDVVTSVKYEIDDIIYKTTIQPKPESNQLNKTSYTLNNRIGSSGPIKLQKLITFNSSDTVFETDGFGFDEFIEVPSYKNNRLVGLIDKPIVESNLFIERDEYSIFERHQRLSEINNLADLYNYRGGYYENINNI